MTIRSLIPFISSPESNERPPKPDDTSGTKEERFDLKQVTVEYVNGETETFETNRVRVDDTSIGIFETSPSVHHYSTRGVSCSISGESDVIIPYETLAKRPIIENVGETVVEYEYTLTHEWRFKQHGFKKTWRETLSDHAILDVTEVYDEQ